MSIDRNNFTIKNTSITDNGEGWENFLREIFIADPSYADKYRSLVGTIRIPIILDGDSRPRTKAVNEHDPKCVNTRSARLMMFKNYLKEKNLKGTDFRYAEIIYTGPRKEGWYEYDNTLAKFIDYVLPLLKERVKEVSIDDVVFTEHGSPEKEPVSMHVLYTSSEPCEFTAIWNLYLDFLEQKENKETDSSEQSTKNAEGNESSTQGNLEDNHDDMEDKSSEENILNVDKSTENEIESPQETSSEVNSSQKDETTDEDNDSIEQESFVPSVDDLPDDTSVLSEEESDVEEDMQNFGDLDLNPTEEEYADENED